MGKNGCGGRWRCGSDWGQGVQKRPPPNLGTAPPPFWEPPLPHFEHRLPPPPHGGAFIGLHFPQCHAVTQEPISGRPVQFHLYGADLPSRSQSAPVPDRKRIHVGGATHRPAPPLVASPTEPSRTPGGPRAPPRRTQRPPGSLQGPPCPFRTPLEPPKTPRVPFRTHKDPRGSPRVFFETPPPPQDLQRPF